MAEPGARAGMDPARGNVRIFGDASSSVAVRGGTRSFVLKRWWQARISSLSKTQWS